MEIKGTLQPEDVLAGQWLHMKPAPFFSVVGILLIALFLWALWLSFFGSYQLPVYANHWVFPGAAVYFVLHFSLWFPYKVKRSYRQHKSLQREFSFLVSDDGVFGQNEKGQVNVPWTEYLKWKENKKCFLLYLSDSMFQVIPKRFFQSEDAIEEFRKILKARVRSK